MFYVLCLSVNKLLYLQTIAHQNKLIVYLSINPLNIIVNSLQLL